MALYITKQNTSQAGYKKLFERTKENDSPEYNHVFLTPDRFTVSVERDLVKHCFPDGFARADVMSFTRFAIKTLGKGQEKCLSKEGTVILLRKVLRQHANQLRRYKNVVGYDFAKELFAAIASLRTAGMKTDDIMKVAENVGGTLGDKLHDIALIEKGYEEELAAGKFSDTVTRIDELASVLNKIDLSHTHFYTMGFFVYSKQQRNVLQILAKRAASLNLSVVEIPGCAACPGSDQIESLIKFCKDNGIAVEDDFDEEKENAVDPGMDYVRKGIFNPNCKVREDIVVKRILSCEREDSACSECRKQNGEDATFCDKTRCPFNETGKKPEKKAGLPVNAVVFREESPYEEILATAREINRLVRKEGYRYKDVAVVVNDENYLPILRETFDRCDVPNFIDVGYPVKDGLAARFVFSLLEAAEYRNETAFYRLARHPYLKVSEEDAEAFIRYCRKYGVRYGRFERSFSEDVLRKEIDKDKEKAKQKEREQAEKVREAVMFFVKEIEKKGTAAYYGEKLKEFLFRKEATEATQEHFASDDDRKIAAAKREPVKKLLEEFALLAGDEVFDVYGYASTLAAALADMRIALRPDFCDAVFVGNTEESRFDGVKAAFFLGCTDDNFPKKTGDGLIFSAFDNEAMRKKEMEIFPSPIERNALERFVLRDILSKISDRAYFGSSESALDGSKQSPGDGMSEIVYLTGLQPKRLASYYSLTPQNALLYRLVNDKNALYEYHCGDLKDATDAVRERLIKVGKLNEPSRTKEVFSVPFKIDKKGRKTISVSKLETYFTCPYRYYMRYVLGVDQEEDNSLRQNIVGSIVHDVLCGFFEEYASSFDPKRDYSSEIKSTIEAVFSKDEYDAFRADPMAKHRLEELKKECENILNELVENQRYSEFRPVLLEASFGDDRATGEDKNLFLNTQNDTFKVDGKVDRVDEYNDQVVIVDYKTGGVKSGLKYVRYGIKIQLYIYLQYFVNQGKKPAGVFYLPIRGTNVKGGRSYAMEGQIKNDFEVYRALDKRVDAADETVCTSFSSATIAKKASYTAKRKGWDISQNSGGLMSDEGFSAVLKYVRALSEQALTEITEGYFERKPFSEGDCGYCPYARCCGKVPHRVSEVVKKEDVFIEAMKKPDAEEGKDE